MSGIFGWLGSPSLRRDADRVTARMAQRLTWFNDAKFEHVDTVLGTLGCASIDGSHNTWHGERGAAVIQGRFSWRDKTRAGRAAEAGNAQTVFESYLEQGMGFPDSLQGNFSGAMLDFSSSRLIVFTDRLGVHPVVSTETHEGIAFASTSDCLRAHSEDPVELNEQSIVDYLYLHQIPTPLSIFRGYQYLLPGTLLRFDKAGGHHHHRYWTPTYTQNLRGQSFEELRAKFQSLIGSSIQNSVAHGTEVGAFLSGGTDSSTIVAFLSQYCNPARAFSIAFDNEEFDELGYAKIAAARYSADHHFRYVAPRDVLDSLPDIARIYDEPFGNSSAVPTYHCASFAKATGITHLLGGDGGDELFGGNERYGLQNMLSMYSSLPGWLRNGVLNPIAGSRVFESPRTPLRYINRYVAHARTPLPDRLQMFNVFSYFGPEAVLERDFLQSVDREHAFELMREQYRIADYDNELNGMLAFDLKLTLADNDLRKVTRMCDLAGVSVDYPLLSDDLVEFASQLPTQLKVRGTKLRPFFKAALADVLPTAVIKKQKHGFGLPFGIWALEHAQLREFVYDNLGSLKKRTYIRPTFIDSLIDDKLDTHPRYFGTMVWLLLMLELWFQNHADGRSRSVPSASKAVRN